MILGTGVGAASWCAWSGARRRANAIAGEWGHSRCPCRRATSAPAGLLLRPLRLCRNLPERPGHGLPITPGERRGAAPEAIVAGAAAGDAACEATLRRYEARLARALAGVINLLDPDVIVLGGGLSNLARLYAHVPRHWAAHVFSDQVDTRLPGGHPRRIRPGSTGNWPVVAVSEPRGECRPARTSCCNRAQDDALRVATDFPAGERRFCVFLQFPDVSTPTEIQSPCGPRTLSHPSQPDDPDGEACLANV